MPSARMRTARSSADMRRAQAGHTWLRARHHLEHLQGAPWRHFRHDGAASRRTPRCPSSRAGSVPRATGSGDTPKRWASSVSSRCIPGGNAPVAIFSSIASRSFFGVVPDLIFIEEASGIRLIGAIVYKTCFSRIPEGRPASHGRRRAVMSSACGVRTSGGARSGRRAGAEFSDRPLRRRGDRAALANRPAARREFHPRLFRTAGFAARRQKLQW